MTSSPNTNSGTRKSYWFYYEDGEGQIRIRAKRRPGPNTRPKGHCWKLQEEEDGKWVMPFFPEVTWRMLRDMHFVKKEAV